MGAWHGEPSPTRSGSGFDRSCLVRSATRAEGGPGPTRVAVSRAFSGSSGRARRGANCRGDTGARRPAGAACGSGRSAACSWRSGAPFSTSSTIARRFAGTGVSSTAAPAKKGAPNRQDQTRQGNQVDGTGRWRGYSVGSIPGRGVPGGGQAPRPDPRYRRSHPGASGGAAADVLGPADRRPRVGQQHRPALAQAAVCSADHSGAVEQPSGDRSGRSLVATVSPALDRGAHVRMAGLLPPPDGAL